MPLQAAEPSVHTSLTVSASPSSQDAPPQPAVASHTLAPAEAPPHGTSHPSLASLFVSRWYWLHVTAVQVLESEHAVQVPCKEGSVGQPASQPLEASLSSLK